MERKKLVIIAVILLLSILNYNRLQDNEHIRAIQFVSIFVIGALSGLLLKEFIAMLKGRIKHR